MADITSETTLEELAAIISQGLADQGLIGDPLLEGPCPDLLEITAGEADVDALILLPRSPG